MTDLSEVRQTILKLLTQVTGDHSSTPWGWTRARIVHHLRSQYPEYATHEALSQLMWTDQVEVDKFDQFTLPQRKPITNGRPGRDS